MVAGFEGRQAFSFKSLQRPFVKDGVITIELKVTGWAAGDFEPLADALSEHGLLVGMRFDEAGDPPAEEESGDPAVDVPSPS